MDINKQVAIITGGGSGMGAETAIYLSKAGAKVAILDSDLQKAELVAAQIDGIAIRCDVSDAANAEQAIAQVVAEFKIITICVNCAGIAPAARIVGHEGAMPLAGFNHVIQVNLLGLSISCDCVLNKC